MVEGMVLLEPGTRVCVYAFSGVGGGPWGGRGDNRGRPLQAGGSLTRVERVCGDVTVTPVWRMGPRCRLECGC